MSLYLFSRTKKLQETVGEVAAYSSPPPAYPCIRGLAQTQTHNNLFDCYVNMQSRELVAKAEDLNHSTWEEESFGVVMNRRLFLSIFNS